MADETETESATARSVREDGRAELLKELRLKLAEMGWPSEPVDDFERGYLAACDEVQKWTIARKFEAER